LIGKMIRRDTYWNDGNARLRSVFSAALKRHTSSYALLLNMAFSIGLLPDAPSVGPFKSDPEFQAIVATRKKENAQLLEEMRAIEASYH
jgi:hypothetical protein